VETTIATEHYKAKLFKNMTWKDLNSLDFDSNSFFSLGLPNGTLYVSSVLRIIPQKRVVVIAEWNKKLVVAKIFFSSKAKQHLTTEVQGIKNLQEMNIPTPRFYYQGRANDKKIYVLVLEKIADSKNLDEIFQEHILEDRMDILQAVVKELATQHVFGIVQKDLHLKNFLVTGKTIYTLDGSKIETNATLLPKNQSIENLALFLSQLGIGQEDTQERLFHYYAKLRAWLLKPEDKKELFQSIKQWSDLRWQRFEKKIFRDGTQFVVNKHVLRQGVVVRKHNGHELNAFLQNPESAFKNSNATILKNGRSTTVIQIALDNQLYVIKRYNIKNIWHFLRRCLRYTRARSSWRLMHKLNFFGIPTAKPIAFLENYILGIFGKSYLVTEYVANANIAEFLETHKHDDTTTQKIIKKMSALLKNLAKLEITHGDLKKTNILIDNNEIPVLIDLDGTSEHLSISNLHKAWHAEIERFLENFEHQPEILDQFKQELYDSSS
jgi:tRNA A-37 threonylcarbamoyl transferase component Bud32